MKKIVVVGSGASGVHFALSVLKKGYPVTMLDVGFQKPDVLNPEDNFNKLKSNLENPVHYFLGKNFEAFIPPDNDAEYYGFPPSKNHVFLKPPQFSFAASGFEPLFSFAQGGLAETWTGGVYPLNERELELFPFSLTELKPYYERVAARIGISGAKDDLAPLYPFHEHILPSMELDPNSRILLNRYQKYKKKLNTDYNFFMGRSRIATLSRDKDGRKACASRGRCIWGCPGESLYTPSITLNACKRYDNFTYVPGMYVRNFAYDSKGQVLSVTAESLANGQKREFKLDRLVLAAGTLSSSKIFLESIFRKTGKVLKLKGFMDNRQILIPFLNLRMVGKPTQLDFYQYHLLSICIGAKDSSQNVHGQITTCKSAVIHPIVRNVPCDLKNAIYVFRNLHSALGIINMNFGDSRRKENFVTLQADPSSGNCKLAIHYQPRPGEKETVSETIKTVKRILFKLGCIVPPGTIHTRPMGASVHYSGTIPMSAEALPFTTSKVCQSNDFRNLYFVDGTTLPFLPAKNLTFTLMANAARVAEEAF